MNTENKIDLRNCNPGDRLRGRQGSILEYIAPTPHIGLTYLDHVVRYVKRPDGSRYNKDNYGTRTHDGYVFKMNRMPEVDEDIVEVIK